MGNNAKYTLLPRIIINIAISVFMFAFNKYIKKTKQLTFLRLWPMQDEKSTFSHDLFNSSLK